MSKKTKQNNTRPTAKAAAVKERPDVSASRNLKRPPSSKEKNFLSGHWKPALVIFLLSFGLYIQSVSFSYVMDDTILITENKYTQKGIAGIPEIFRYESFRGYFGDQQEMVEGGRYRPLSIATFAIEKSLTNNDSRIAHLINVLLYALTGIFLYRVLLFMFPRARSDSARSRWFFTVPFVAVVLYMAHPLHVEVVANVKGRDEIFALIAEACILIFSFKWLSTKNNKYLLFSFLSYFLGILSKENVITFLAVVPITFYFFSKSSFSERLKIMIPLITGTVIYLMIRLAVLGQLFSGREITDLMNNPFYGLSFGEKTATIFYTLLLYLKLMVYPHPLTHDYYPYHIPVITWTDWRAILSLVIYLGLLLVVINTWRKRSVIAYSILFYLITLSIVSNLFISVGTFMNERFVYHASLGFCIAVAWLLVEKIKYRSVGLSVFTLGTFGLSAKTLIRLPDWKDRATLDRAAYKVSWDSARANHFYGATIWNDVFMTLPPNTSPERKKAVLDSASLYFYKALEILPSYHTANSMKAGVAAEYHKLDNDYPKLIKAFEEVNRTGTYEKFILEYLKYINKRVGDLKNASLLEAFYKRMVAYYDMTSKNTTLPGEYRALLQELQERMKTMQ